MVNGLDPYKYPPALNDIVVYLKDWQSFWLWMAQQELAFRKSGKFPQTEYNGVDLAGQVPASTKNLCEQIVYRWSTCANKRDGEKSRELPHRKVESSVGRSRHPRRAWVRDELGQRITVFDIVTGSLRIPAPLFS
jgi:hypothetical protein